MGSTISMATQFSHLYEICRNKTVTLRQVVDTQGRVVTFKRQFDQITLKEWTSILLKISAISFTHTYE